MALERIFQDSQDYKNAANYRAPLGSTQSSAAVNQNLVTAYQDNNTQLATAIQGMLSDNRAYIDASVNTMKTMEQSIKRMQKMSAPVSEPRDLRDGRLGADTDSDKARKRIKDQENPEGTDKKSPSPGTDNSPAHQKQTLDDARKQGQSLRGIAKALQSHLGGAEEGTLGAKLLGSVGEDGAASGGALGALANGDSLLSAGAGLLGDSSAGPIGLAIGGFGAALKFGSDFMVGQRQQNAVFQSIYGGSNFGTGLSNRAQQMGFEIGSMGVLDSGQADKLFQGVSATGLSGAARQNALNFAVSNYTGLGMDTSQSMPLIQTASQNAGQNLNDVASALSAVSVAAASAGVNANVARDGFTNLYTSLANAGFGGAAAGVASTVTNYVSGMGRQAQGTTIDMTSQRAVAIQAAAMGMSVPEFQGMGGGNAKGPLAIQAEAQVMNRFVSGPAGAAQRAIAASYASKIKGGIIKNISETSGVGKALLTGPGAQSTFQMGAELAASGVTGKNGQDLEGTKALLAYANLISGKDSLTYKALPKPAPTAKDNTYHPWVRGWANDYTTDPTPNIPVQGRSPSHNASLSKAVASSSHGNTLKAVVEVKFDHQTQQHLNVIVKHADEGLNVLPPSKFPLGRGS